MNEFSRCCQVLGVKPGISLGEVKKTYRDLVQVWHPDRFAGNDRLQTKAQEQLKEINLAYHFLMANSIVEDRLTEPVAPTDAASGAAADESAATEENADVTDEAAGKSKAKLAAQIASIVVMLLACLLFFYVKRHPDGYGGAGKSFFGTAPGPYLYSKDLLAQMTSANGGNWMQATQLLTPPFNLKVKFKLNAPTEFRVRYEFGSFVFNALDNPTDLFVRAPRSFEFARISEQGFLQSNDLHELNWQITPTNQTLTIDGQVRFQRDGFFDSIRGFPAFRSKTDDVAVSSFVIETPQPLTNTVTPARIAVTNDLLPEMIPDHNLRVVHGPEGTVLSLPGSSENGFRTPEHYHPPFVIRTRAKTDALNLRLFCGVGQIMLNWDGDPYKLKYVDPVTRRAIETPGKGMVTPNEWHLLRWEFDKKETRLFVDDQLRWLHKSNFEKLDGTVGIGAAMSRVTVDYFTVEQK